MVRRQCGDWRARTVLMVALSRAVLIAASLAALMVAAVSLKWWRLWRHW